MFSFSKACIFVAQEQCIAGRFALYSSKQFLWTSSCYSASKVTYLKTTEKVKLGLQNNEAAWSTTQIRSISYEEKQKKQRTHAQKMIDMFDLPTKKKKFETRKPFDYSGDFGELEPLKDDETMFVYRGLEDKFKEFPQNYSKVTSLEYADGQEKMAHRIWTMQEKFLNICKYGERSEMIIAQKTIQIRNLKEHCQKNKKDTLARVILLEQIQGRKKELKKLRKRDYKRFIWLLKELELLYRPHPLYVDLNTRRARMRQYLREETCRIIREKINAVYTRLDSEKENFYTEKEKVLSEIRKDLSDHNISAYDVLQNVRKLRQERVVERQNKAPPTPNTYRWIQSDKDRKKAERRERDLHRNALVKKGMQMLAQSEEAS